MHRGHVCTGSLLLELIAAGANSECVVLCIVDSSRLEQLNVALKDANAVKRVHDTYAATSSIALLLRLWHCS
jgi:hypothetical protein